jgi:hypothetical protein
MLTVSLVLAGDLASFDKAAFRQNLAKSLGPAVSAADVTLHLQSASVAVTAQVLVAGPRSAKEDARGVLRVLLADEAAATKALNVTVEQIARPPDLEFVLRRLVEPMQASEMALAAVGAVLLLCLLVCLGFIWTKRCLIRRKLRAPLVKGKKRSLRLPMPRYMSYAA